MTGGAPAAANPYPGLVAFGADEEAWFFGRDREQKIIGANLRSSRLTLLYGASGVGKSSVLQAAVIPSLRRVVERDRAARELDDADVRKPVRFAVVTFGAWRDAPLEGLMTAVAASVGEATGAAVEPWTPGTPVRETLAVWLRSVKSLLIVLDQFEEYFLYHPLDDGPGTFAGEFVEILNDADLRVNLLLSLREDELAKLDRFQGQVPGLFDNYLRVEHLDVEAARLAVLGPKDEYNRGLAEGSEPATIDEELIEEVLEEVRTRAPVARGARDEAPERPGASVAIADRVETPLLQLVMQRLWLAATAAGGAPQLRLSTLREQLGGTENIVRRHLEDALAALSGEDRDLAVDILRSLISPTGTKIAWRAADLAHWAKAPAERIAPILRELSSGERRILRPVMPPASHSDQTPSYEIFHDILATPILEWCADREEERARAELEREANERQLAERRRRRRRRRRIWRVLTFGLIVVLLVAARIALQRSEIADSRALAASANTQLAFDPERSLLLAIRAMERHDTGAAQDALRLSLASSHARAVLGAGRPKPCAACADMVTTALGRSGAVAEPVAIAPDGRTIAAVREGRLRLWRPVTGATFRPRVDVGTATAVAFTPDARRLLVMGTAGAATMAPDGTGAVALRGAWDRGVTSPDSRHVVTVGDGGAAVWDARDGRRVARLGTRDAPYLSAAFASPERIMLQNGYGELLQWRWRSGATTLLIVGREPSLRMQYAPERGFALDSSSSGRVRVVDARGVSRTLPPGTYADPLDASYISPDGLRVATLQASRVELWRSDRPWRAPAERVAELVHGDGINAVVFSADSALLATVSLDGTGRVWESATGGLVAELSGHTAGVEAAAFSSNGRFVATVGEDLTVRLWDLGSQHTLRLARSVGGVAAAGTGTRVAVVEDDGALRIWDAGGATSRHAGPRSPLRSGDARRDLHATSVAVARDDGSVVAGYEEVLRATGGEPPPPTGRAVVVDIGSGRVRSTIKLPGPVRQVAVDRTGRLAAIVYENAGGTRTEVWDLRAPGGPVRVWRVPLGDAERPSDAAFSPDGGRLLVTSVFGAARVYNLATFLSVLKLADGRADDPDAEAFYRGVFSPDGRTVAAAGSRDVRLWDLSTGKERGFRLTGHTSVLRSVAFDATGRRIVTASADGTTRVWDPSDGTMLSVIRRHAGVVNGATFLRNGSIVSVGDDRTVRAYPCPTCAGAAMLLDQARRQVTRELTSTELAQFGE